MTQNKSAGFTLIELSIVLVIIGLIIGGILVGQDMIKAAEVRATVGQIEKYNSAVNTFRSKYNAIPGDMPQQMATNFGFWQLTVAPTDGAGDGNGLLEGGGAGLTVPQGETLLFWRHLSEANLVDGSLGQVGNAAIVAATGLVTGAVTSVSQSIPPTKINLTNYLAVYSVGGFNFYQILPIASVTTVPDYTFNTTGITPMQANNIDLKLDDGLPNTGIVIARFVTGVNIPASWVVTTTADTCMMNGTSATDPTTTYNLNKDTGGNNPSCTVRFRFN
jgi:prepilin-type N-terminal cleavage/methylation domain-containing protein